MENTSPSYTLLFMRISPFISYAHDICRGILSPWDVLISLLGLILMRN